MFAKLAIILTSFSVAVFATGGPSANAATNLNNVCNTGAFQCCQSVHEGSSDVGSAVGALLGLNVQNIAGQVGLNCVAGNGIGAVTGANCQQHPVCCDKTVDDTLIGLGCLPISAQA